MKAAILEEITKLYDNSQPLKITEVKIPEIEKDEILIKVKACGICHTELDEIEGRTPPSFFPVILGHQVTGIVEKTGEKVTKFKKGDRVGVGWIYSACLKCEYCINGYENLCKEFKATGRDANGGYAEYMKIKEDFAFNLPLNLSFYESAPYFCAGAIGYRALKLTNIKDGYNLGLTGFGASAHLVLQFAKYLYKNIKIFVFARSGKERDFAHNLGAFWTGDINQMPPEKLNAIIDTTPVWKPVVESLKKLKPGGRLVINAIRKEEIDKEYLLNLVYEEHLWMEREIKSVANITRRDIVEFLDIASKMNLKPEIEIFALENINKALMEIKKGIIRGAKVLKIS